MTDKKPKKRKRSPITSVNKPVIDLLRSEFPDAKIWLANDDTIEVNRKPVLYMGDDGMPYPLKATPKAGDTVEEHVRVCSSSIRGHIEAQNESAQVWSVVKDVLEERPSRMTDQGMYDRVERFEMPPGFCLALMQRYKWRMEHAINCLGEYKKFMYLQGIYQDGFPPHDVRMVWEMHLLYTESYGSMCSLLENHVHYEQDMPMDRDKYARTTARYQKEFGRLVPDLWDGPADLKLVTTDTNKYLLIRLRKRF